MREDRNSLDLETIKFEVGKPLTVEELVALRRAVGWPARGNYARILEENLFHITARLDGRLVGFLQVVGSAHGDQLIQDLCVHPGLQGHGIGTRLMEMALKTCRAMGPQGVNVLFEEKDRAFFERFGFRMLHGGYLDGPTLNENAGSKGTDE